MEGFSALGEGIIHELSVLGIFAMSFVLWHFAKQRGRPGPKEPSLRAMKLPVAVAPLEEPQQQQHKSPRPAAQDDGPRAVREAEEQMCGLLRQKEFTRALQLYRSLERNGRDQYMKKEDLFSRFVQSAIRVEKFDVVEQLLRLAKRNGVELTLVTWKTFLKILSTKKRFNTCLLAYTIFEGEVPADQVVFSCLVNAALESGMPQEAAKMLCRYKDAGVHPREYVLFFRTYLALGDADAAEATFHEAGTDMTPLMLNLLLLTCVNAKQLDRAERCLQKAHQLEEGGGSKIVNIVSYNTLMKGLAQDGQVEGCFVCLQGLVQHALEPDDTTVGLVVDVCLQDRRSCDAGKDLLDRLMDVLKKAGAQTNTVMYTHFLKFLIKTDRLEDASGLYEEMKQNDRTKPDVISYAMLIKGYVNAHDMERAIRILEDMISEGCNPDDMILTRLLEGCWQAGRAELGVQLFHQFVKIGVVPSDYSILTLVKLMGNAGYHDGAYEIVAGAKQRFGVAPSVIHYTCLMSGALRGKRYEHAWQAFLLMRQRGVQPDATAISTLLPGLAAAQQWERVVEVAGAALKANPPLSIPAEMLNNALSQMLAGGAPERHVLRFQVLMHGSNVAITVRNSQRMR